MVTDLLASADAICNVVLVDARVCLLLGVPQATTTARNAQAATSRICWVSDLKLTLRRRGAVPSHKASVVLQPWHLSTHHQTCID